MSERVVIAIDPGGVPIAVKRSRGPADVARLAREADVLDVARHPGVVELVRFRRDEPASPAADPADGAPSTKGAELVTRFCGPHSLATAPLESAEVVAGTVAAIAATLADLHDLGIVHCRIEPSHVLLAASGRPVLCGWADGGRIGTASLSGPESLHPSVDVRAVGTLLHALLAPPARGIRRWERRSLLTVAERAITSDLEALPTARQLVAALGDAVPRARLPAGDAADASTVSDASDSMDLADRSDDDDARGPQVEEGAQLAAAADVEPRSPRRHLVLAVLALVLVVFGAAVLWTERVTTPKAGHAGMRRATPPTAQSRSCRASDTPRSSEAARADVDGDGCPETLRIDGTDVEAIGRRWSVGSTGDRVTVGDWNCDGRATPALLRPATGEVFVFPRWASADGDLSVDAVARIQGGRSLRSHGDDGRCDRGLLVERADGSIVEVTK